MDEKLALFDAISDPIKSHVHCFGTTLFDGLVADAGCTGVVGLNGSGGLRVTHVFEGGAKHSSFLAIVEQCCEFSFGGGGEYGDHDGGVNVDGAVWRRRRRVGWRDLEWIGEGVAEEEVAAGARACLLLGEIRGVAVDMENHAARVIPEGGFRMGGAIVEELGDGDGGGFGAVVLGRGEGAECD